MFIIWPYYYHPIWLMKIGADSLLHLLKFPYRQTSRVYRGFTSWNKESPPPTTIKSTTFEQRKYLLILFSKPKVNKTSKIDYTSFQLRQSFLSHRHTCKSELYTDGSKTSIGTGGAVCVFSVKINFITVFALE